MSFIYGLIFALTTMIVILVARENRGRHIFFICSTSAHHVVLSKAYVAFHSRNIPANILFICQHPHKNKPNSMFLLPEKLCQKS